MTGVFTIDGVPIEIGARCWYEGHKNVSRDNRAGPGWRDHPAMEVTVVQRIPGGAVEKGSLVIQFDKPLSDHYNQMVGTVQVNVFQGSDGRLYAGYWGAYDFDGFVERCNFFGLYSSKEKRNATWPVTGR